MTAGGLSSEQGASSNTEVSSAQALMECAGLIPLILWT